jgi:hypothetical protein
MPVPIIRIAVQPHAPGRSYVRVAKSMPATLSELDVERSAAAANATPLLVQSHASARLSAAVDATNERDA